ncbi:ABC transporter ATP-binding protein [Candidatus Methylopumilus universalis]|jgi:peptide/nickel transport system ATP-binding protein/oligopeptide transport system ATP-binding protein|uniref:ATP-binding cassette domain-containing protein n=1 Tax=Candidatus Methylopumilus universalis TaxID=2588536 RepID=UPI00111FFC3F|nr:ATP-binding cassette domain-containing protein [Candidatus Methylopumilus universalis]QDC89392.1 ABC transporter ATP-binding protein [Candidatus Methylopumilus universalis]QDC90693.1 ABC transporter ATP-binding protein [Candidatus Methylopumilus universalis]
MAKIIKNEVLLEAKDLYKTYTQTSGFFVRKQRTIKALNNVSLSIKKGETLAIVGESGSGKSTLARCLLQLLSLDQGELFFKGKNLNSLDVEGKKYLKRHIQMVFQDPYASLNPRMKISEILEEGLLIHDLGNKIVRDKKMRDMIKKVGLEVSDLNKYPHQFSGGQRQRIGIARALIVEPELVICDEPVSALDVSIQAQILLLLKELQKELGLSYLFISHDLRVVRHMADTIAVMHQGKIVEQGTIKGIYEKPKANYTRELLNAIPGNHFKFKVS